MIAARRWLSASSSSSCCSQAAPVAGHLLQDAVLGRPRGGDAGLLGGGLGAQHVQLVALGLELLLGFGHVGLVQRQALLLGGDPLAQVVQGADEVVVGRCQGAHQLDARHEVLPAVGADDDVEVRDVALLVHRLDALFEVPLLGLELGLGARELRRLLLEVAAQLAQPLARLVELLAHHRDARVDARQRRVEDGEARVELGHLGAEFALARLGRVDRGARLGESLLQLVVARLVAGRRRGGGARERPGKDEQRRAEEQGSQQRGDQLSRLDVVIARACRPRRGGRDAHASRAASRSVRTVVVLGRWRRSCSDPSHGGRVRRGRDAAARRSRVAAATRQTLR